MCDRFLSEFFGVSPSVAFHLYSMLMKVKMKIFKAAFNYECQIGPSLETSQKSDVLWESGEHQGREVLTFFSYSKR
jgi:hypothetical protein